MAGALIAHWGWLSSANRLTCVRKLPSGCTVKRFSRPPPCPLNTMFPSWRISGWRPLDAGTDILPVATSSRAISVSSPRPWAKTIRPAPGEEGAAVVLLAGGGGICVTRAALVASAETDATDAAIQAGLPLKVTCHQALPAIRPVMGNCCPLRAEPISGYATPGPDRTLAVGALMVSTGPAARAGAAPAMRGARDSRQTRQIANTPKRVRWSFMVQFLRHKKCEGLVPTCPG